MKNRVSVMMVALLSIIIALGSAAIMWTLVLKADKLEPEQSAQPGGTTQPSGWIDNGNELNIDLEYVPGAEAQVATQKVFRYEIDNDSTGPILVSLQSSPTSNNVELSYLFSERKVDEAYYGMLEGQDLKTISLDAGNNQYLYLIVNVTDATKEAIYKDDIEIVEKEAVVLTYDLGCGVTQTDYVEKGTTIATNAIRPVPTNNVLGCELEGWYSDSECSTEADFTQALNADTTVYAKCAYVKTDWLSWNGQSYDIVDGTGEIPSELIIPAIYNDANNGEGAVGLSGGAFNNNPNITSVVFPDTITEIFNTFMNCDSIESVTIPSSVEGIAQSFSNCSNLKEVIFEPNSQLGWMTELVFSSCPNLQQIALPSGLKDFGMSVLCNTGLTSIIIPSSVTGFTTSLYECDNLKSVIFEEDSQIEDLSYAITYCPSLTSAIIPAGVTGVDCAFNGCVNLANIMVEEGNALYTSRDSNGNECNAVIKIATKTLIIGSINAIIPNDIKAIDYSAFSGMAITSIIIPSSVESIASSAFSECGKLESIVVESGNKVYDSRNNCNAIIETASGTLVRGCKNTIIPNTVVTIGEYAFEGADLTSITIPSGVRRLERYAFAYCDSLTSITIPASVIVIGHKIFQDCSNLTSVILEDVNNWGYFCEEEDEYENIITTLVTIPSDELRDSEKILVYLNDDENYRGIKKIRLSLTDNCFAWDSATNGYRVVSIGIIEGNIEIPSTHNDGVHGEANVTSIDAGAFYDCFTLSSIVIPSSVTSIGASAFYGCEGLTSVTFAEGSQLLSIDEGAFSYCASLTSITLPSSVTSIGDGAFFCCASLTSITLPSSVTSIGDSAFFCCVSLTSITIPASVTSIGEYAFYYCTSLTSITLPASVTIIGASAFYGCEGLTSVTFEEGSQLLSIDEAAFSYCTSLTSITLPSSVTSIGDNAFYSCSKLTDITIPASVTSIGDGAFFCCASLTSITLPSSVTSIGDNAFYSCSKLTDITIPASVTSIGDGAFRGCSGLTSVTFEEGSQLLSIGAEAFYGCSKLTNITIPASVTTIGSNAFGDCYDLTITMADTESTWYYEYEEEGYYDTGVTAEDVAELLIDMDLSYCTFIKEQ